jgi:hypothetical protein
MNFWNEIGTLERLARWAPYAFIALGFFVAVLGQFARSTLESRIAILKHETEAALKRTPPDYDAYLATSERTGALLVVIDAKNEIPIRARWRIVTDDNQIVSGIMLEDHEIHPTQDQKRFSSKADIDETKVVNDFIELRFKFESVYSAEFGNPSDLKGQVVRSYRYKGGRVFPT